MKLTISLEKGKPVIRDDRGEVMPRVMGIKVAHRYGGVATVKVTLRVDGEWVILDSPPSASA